MEKYKVFNLRDNPFKDVTPNLSIDSKPEWAGLSELQMSIQKVYSDTLSSYARQIVLNWGAWGGGKTFSSIYFSNQSFSTKQIQVTQAYIQLPKEGNKSTTEFFISIIETISFSNIQNQIRTTVEKFGYDHVFDMINNRIRSAEFTRAILKIADDNEEIQELMYTYIFSGLNRTDLRKVGLPRVIQTDKDRVRVLAGILLCFIGNGTYKGRFILWIDEMEDLFYYSPKNYRAFSQVLRDFSDLLTEGFSMFLNFTLSEPDESTLQMLLGPALLSRINKRIRYQELSEETAIKYIEDLLKPQTIGNRSPFTEEIIKLVLETIPESEMTPREINKRFSSFLDYCIDIKTKSLNKSSVNQFIEHLTNND